MTHETKWTPGPWRAREMDGHGARRGDMIIEAELPCINGLCAWFMVACVYERDDAEKLMSEGVLADSRDDAALIAAARDLAAACQRVLDAVEDGDEMAAVEMCRAALSKARGGVTP